MKTGKVSAAAYHWATSHVRGRITPHSLDFDTYPLPAKPYDRSNALALGISRPEPGVPVSGQDRTGICLDRLGDLLYLAYGVTMVRQARGIPVLYRTVPSAGGLYPCHLYLGVQGMETNETGVYYYDPVHHCLVGLRKQENVSPEPELAGAARLFFIITARFYTSAWKYRNRAYRYMLLDSGHLAENLLIVLKAWGAQCRIYAEFADFDLAELLGLDLTREVPMACVSGDWDTNVSTLVRTLKTTTLASFPDLMPRPGEDRYMAGYGNLAQMHAAWSTGLVSPDVSGTGEAMQEPLPSTVIDRPPLSVLKQSGREPVQAGWNAAKSPDLARQIITRRSRRNFIQSPISVSAFTTLVSALKRSADDDAGLTPGMVSRDVDGVADGFYIFSDQGLALMEKGNLAPKLAQICLDQAWIGHAGLNFLFFANLAAIEGRFGSQGYRRCMMAAGRQAQQIYLAAESLGYGCCGVGAIYDREAAQRLGLNPDSALIYLLSVGPVKAKARHGN